MALQCQSWSLNTSDFSSFGGAHIMFPNVQESIYHRVWVVDCEIIPRLRLRHHHCAIMAEIGRQAKHK